MCMCMCMCMCMQQAASILGIIIAVTSVPLLGFDLDFSDTDSVRWTHLLSLNSEQRQRVGITAKPTTAKDGKPTAISEA